MEPIPDSLGYDLKILFVGFNPSIRSSETGHHFANPNNRFWTILHRAGLTPHKYHSEEDRDLLQFGYGFTNIVARPTRTAAEITKQEYIDGRNQLKNKFQTYHPKVVCFVGKGVYEEYSQKKKICWGLQSESIISGIKEFVAPSSSGLVRMKLDDVVEIYKDLYPLIKE